MPANLKNQQWPQDWKRSVFIPVPKKGNAKECSNYHTIAFILHTSKIMLKILQARLQQYMNCELSDVQAGLRKARGTRDQIANIRWIIEKQESSRKTSALLTMPKPLTVAKSQTWLSNWTTVVWCTRLATPESSYCLLFLILWLDNNYLPFPNEKTGIWRV